MTKLLFLTCNNSIQKRLAIYCLHEAKVRQYHASLAALPSNRFDFFFPFEKNKVRVSIVYDGRALQ
jgi:hypothetical protein